MMQRSDVSGARVHDEGHPRDVRQGAWSDGSVGHPGADLQTSGAELVQRGAQKPVSQQLFDKRNGRDHGCDRDVEKEVTSQASDIVMQLESFEENDDNHDDRSDSNAHDEQQVTNPCQVKSLAKSSTPVAAWGCDSSDGVDKNGVCDINGTASGQLEPSAAKSPCTEEESLANKPVESRKRRSILRRASSLWRSKSHVDLRGCQTETNVGDEEVPTKKSFRLFKKGTLKLAAVKRFEEGGKKGKELGMKKGVVSQSMSNIHIPGDDGGGTSVIPDVPPKKTFGLFKKAALKVRAVKRFEESVKGRGNKEEDSLVGNGDDTGLPCLDEGKEPHSDLSEVSPHVSAKKSFSLFKRAASKLTASKRLEVEANARKDEEESVFESTEEEELEGDGNDVCPIMDNVMSYDGGNMLDSDSDDVEDDNRMDDNHESSVNSFVKEDTCDSLPVTVRNTKVMAWGECGTDIDCGDNVSLSSCDRFTVNGGASKASVSDTEKLQAEAEVKEKSPQKINNQARGRFKKALTFLKAMNGFRGGSKTIKGIESAIIEEIAEDTDVVSLVISVQTDVVSSYRESDCDVVSPFTCADHDDAVSSYIQVWDGEMSSEEEDTVQCVEPDRPVSKTNMYASILELSSDESSNQSDDDDANQSDDDDASDGSSELASHQPCDVNDRLGEEPVIVNEVTESDGIVPGESLKAKDGKRKIKRAFLVAKIVGLFKTKSNSSTKTLAVPPPEDGTSGSVADFDQAEAKSDRCDSDGESVGSLSGDCSDVEKSVTDTDEAIECAALERSEEVNDVDAVCETPFSPSSQIRTSPCHSAISHHLNPNYDDTAALSGSDASELTSNLSVPASPSVNAEVHVAKPAATESKVVKRWKWFSQKKKANKKPNDVEVPNTTAGEPDQPTADDSHDVMMEEGHLVPQGGCRQVECGACDTCDR